MNITIDNCIIEITRRCNMLCDHCLRGDQEPIDIQKEYIDKLMSKVSVINCITITGGEPSLKPSLINYIIESAKKYEVEIYGFYIATNARMVTKRFLDALLNLWIFCDGDVDDYNCIVHWSNDIFHEDSINSKALHRLKSLSFVHKKFEMCRDFYDYDINTSRPRVLNEGRGENFPWNTKPSTLRFSCNDNTYNEFEECSIEMLYLNALGFLLPDCDYSYDTQREFPKLHVNDMTIEAIENYNQEE